MSNFGGPSSNFEKDFRRKFKRINKTLSRIEERILFILRQSMVNPQKTNRYWKAVRKQIKDEYAKMISAFNQWANVQIPRRYRQSIIAINKRFSNIKSISISASKNLKQILNSRGSIEAMRLLADNAIEDFSVSALAGKRNVDRWTRLTQQKLIDDAQIDLTISSAFTESGNLGRSITGVNSQLWNVTTESLEKKHFVQAGSRKYTSRYYAEMVSRVKFHEAHSQASLMQATNYDTDLMIVSSHNTTTAICQEFEGKIFSITGKDKRFPVLTETPPYHVNCLHLLFPIFIEALEAQKTLDSFSAFSKGKISKPPVPAGFVPLSERGGQ